MWYKLKGDRAFTVPLVSYISNSVRFWYYASLSNYCQNLEKDNWGHRENLGESGGKTFKESDREKCQFSTLATSNIGLLLFFGKEDQ